MSWTTWASTFVGEQLNLWLLNFADLSAPCFFTCPPYTYHQDDDVIIFVIKVPNIALDTVSLGFNKNKVSDIDWTSVVSVCYLRSSCQKAKFYCSPWAHAFNFQISLIWQLRRLSFLKFLTQPFKKSEGSYLPLIDKERKWDCNKRPGGRFSKDPVTYRARKVILKPMIRLPWKPALLICFR